MFILLITVLGLMLWSIQLMVSAFRQSDFSLLFAGTLVAISSAGIVTAYSLMNGYMGFLNAAEVVAARPIMQHVPITNEIIRENQSEPQWIQEVPLVEVDS